MSPVVRIRMPSSKAFTKAEKARLVGAPGDRLELDGADQAEIADVDDVRQALQRMQRVFPVCGELGAARQQALLLVGLERARARPREATGLPE